MKKKNKGFTLIELLAVIVILGIILTIVVSNVVKYIGKAREGAFKDTYAKVLKDVSNKIALNDLGGDTEGVACKCPTECAAAYDVPEENIALLVTKLNDDKYSVSMKGIGSYSSIALTSTSKPNNAGLIDGQTISSIIDSDGEVKENKTGNSNFFNELTKNDSNLTVVDAASLKIISYITYKDANDNETTKFYGIDGKEMKNKSGVTLSFENTDELKKALIKFSDFIETDNTPTNTSDFEYNLTGGRWYRIYFNNLTPENVESSYSCDTTSNICNLKSQNSKWQILYVKPE